MSELKVYFVIHQQPLNDIENTSERKVLDEKKESGRKGASGIEEIGETGSERWGGMRVRRKAE